MFIGNFEVLSGEIIIADPCYDLNDGEKLKAKNGKYNFYTEEDCVISKFIVSHVDFSVCKKYITKDIDGLGVDSGQMSVFDFSKFKKDDWILEEEYPLDIEDNFYGACCHLTLHTEENAGTLKFGAVSTSGYGDGFYNGFAKVNEQGEVEYIEISFAEKYKEEEEDYCCGKCGCEISEEEAMHGGLCFDCEEETDEEEDLDETEE